MQKQLYEHCYNPMLKICLRYTKNAEKAAIVYNDAMMKVFKTIHQYKEQGMFFGWVKRIVVNTAIDYIRIKANMHDTKHNELIVESDYVIDAAIFEKMDAMSIRQLIQSLPLKQATVFNLFIYEEYSHNEIAELLQIPASTSRFYLSEARKMLKEKLENNITSLNKAIL